MTLCVLRPCYTQNYALFPGTGPQAVLFINP